jgi:hypothetical protein
MEMLVERADREPLRMEVVNHAAIPEAVFVASQYYGGGTYTAVIDGEKTFRLTVEWIDEEER